MMGPNFRLPSGLRGRFLLAFGEIVALALVAAATGWMALFVTRRALDDTTARQMPRTIAAMALSEHAGRLSAIGPALLDAASADATSALTARKNAELAAARRQLVMLRSDTGDSAPSGEIAAGLERLGDNLGAIAAAVTRRNNAASKSEALLHKALEASAQSAVLFSSQLQSPGRQPAARRRHGVERSVGGLAEPASAPPPLARLQQGVTDVVGLLVAATETGDAQRLEKLRSAGKADMADIDTLLSGLDAGSAALLSPAIASLRQSALGSDGLFAIRKGELDASAAGRRLSAENIGVADRLSGSARAVVAAAERQTSAAAARAAAVQRVESLCLAVVAAVSLAGALVIVWFHLGRDIVPRLNRLGAAMSAIADGRLDVPVGETGGDEIGAIGRAVEAFRRNAVERAPRAERTFLTRPAEIGDRITRLARNEAALQVMFDSVRQGVAIFDRNLMLVAWNQPFCEVLKLPGSFLEGRPSFDDFYRLLGWRGEFGLGGDIERQLAITRSAIDRPLTDERTRRDGTTLEVRRNPVIGGGFVMMYADVTDRKRSEAQTRRAAEQAEAALRELKATQASLARAEKTVSLGRITAGIARDIKKPVNFVNIFATISVELMNELKAALGPALTHLNPDQNARVEVAVANLSGNLERIALQGRRADDLVSSMPAQLLDGSGERRSIEADLVGGEASDLAYKGTAA
jgi:PAS domain-containing protein